MNFVHERLKRAGVSFALVVVFVAALLAGIVLHLDLPPARRALLAMVNGTLQGVLMGTLTLESVDHVGLDGVRGLRVSARAPNGQLVLRAHDIEANVSMPTLMASFLIEDGPMRVVLPRARVRDAEVKLDQADSGELFLAQAFTPVPSSSPPKAGRGVDLRILDIQLDHVDVVRDGPSGLRASLQVIRGGLRTHPMETIVDVDAVSFVAVGPIPFEVSGNMIGQLVVPSKGGLRASTNLDLQLADVPVRVVAQLDGDHLRGGVQVPETQPEQLRQLLPSLPI
ncbi:MAG: hypothetical protein MUF54_13480, partial [Polyangiaceae bacterium]|nr:hypothetical protein [Polyangiaceae bacterium]